uniref:HNH endonuclease n=1 Tax=Tsuneonella flava TaxID=2055955 RepID=UPI0018E45665
ERGTGATKGGIGTPSGSTVRPLDSPHYSNAFEVQLPDSAYPGVSRQRHNQLSNQALHEAFEADPSFSTQMENLYPGIVDGVRPGVRGAYPRSAPTPDVTWHHGDNPGQMQLVPRDQHTTSGPAQDSLHSDGSGGYSNWGTE